MFSNLSWWECVAPWLTVRELGRVGTVCHTTRALVDAPNTWRPRLLTDFTFNLDLDYKVLPTSHHVAPRSFTTCAGCIGFLGMDHVELAQHIMQWTVAGKPCTNPRHYATATLQCIKKFSCKLNLKRTYADLLFRKLRRTWSPFTAASQRDLNRALQRLEELNATRARVESRVRHLLKRKRLPDSFVGIRRLSKRLKK